MEKPYFQNKTFTKIDVVTAADYEDCRFDSCNFSNAALKGYHFSDCVFLQCNLTMANILGTAFREVLFQHCKLLGVHFSDVNAFGLAMHFEHCVLNLCSFYKLKLKSTKFIGCSLRETDFTETDLTDAVFADCDLTKAVFDQTILSGADLRSAHHFSINPTTNKLKGAKFSSTGLSGLVNQLGIIIE